MNRSLIVPLGLSQIPWGESTPRPDIMEKWVCLIGDLADFPNGTSTMTGESTVNIFLVSLKQIQVYIYI